MTRLFSPPRMAWRAIRLVGGKLLIATMLCGDCAPSLRAEEPQTSPAAASTLDKPDKPENPGKLDEIDFAKARELFRRRQSGERLTAEEEAYLRRAMEARRAREARPGNQPVRRPINVTPRETIGQKPLSEMSASDRYKGEDGGLYGQGRNEPPDAHRRAAEAALSRIRPLNADGQPDANGRIVFISISMSNATQEFSQFKRLADRDVAKSNQLTIVDCAQGGQAMAEWANREARAWTEAERRIAAAGVNTQQVQVAWIKIANKGPTGELTQHGKVLQRDTQAVLHEALRRFRNLRIVYLSSRIYGGYAQSNLNPEPYAYESAFVARWLIQDQMAGKPDLNHDPALGPVQAPLLLWGPYLWADGTTPRLADKLTYLREDLAGDGTHPSSSGQNKVARVMLDFYKSDPLAKPWFTTAE